MKKENSLDILAKTMSDEALWTAIHELIILNRHKFQNLIDNRDISVISFIKSLMDTKSKEEFHDI